jgi:glycosyltransferase involved in cell wall biosynthesis
LLPWSEGALHELPDAAASERAIVLPVPVEPSGPVPGERDVAAITYAANPSKKGLDRVLDAWRELRDGRATAAGEELLVAGVSAERFHSAGLLSPQEQGVRVLGALVPEEFRALLRRARVFVCAPRREDYGIVQLEALADGCQLVTTEAPGPYASLPLARELDPRLVGDDLTAALRAALDEPLPGYAERALAALAPFSRAAVDRIVAEQLLPRLLA